jgi:hypothetical protein
MVRKKMVYSPSQRKMIQVEKIGYQKELEDRNWFLKNLRRRKK